LIKPIGHNIILSYEKRKNLLAKLAKLLTEEELRKVNLVSSLLCKYKKLGIQNPHYFKVSLSLC